MGCGFVNTQVNSDEIVRKGNKKNLTLDCRRKSTIVEDFIHEKVKIISSKLNEKQIQFACKHLSKHQFFSGLNQKQLKEVCSQMIYVGAREGDYLFLKDDMCSSFFLIENGAVDIEINEIVVNKLVSGDTFGELALIFKSKRTASVVCKGITNTFLLMKPGLYKKTLQKLKLDELQTNSEFIKKIAVFQFLSNKQRYTLSSIIQPMKFGKGQIIFRKGEDSHAMYIIIEGEVLIQIPGKDNLILTKYQIFGQSSIQNGVRAGTATAIENSFCAVLNKNGVERALGSNINNLMFFSIKKWGLMRSDLFAKYSPSELNSFTMAFQTVKASSNEIINRKTYSGIVISLQGKINGEPEGTVYGEVYNERQILKKNEQGYFGFLSYSKLQEIIAEINEKRKLVLDNSNKLVTSQTFLDLKDFLFIKKLGEGQFGQVYLVKNKNLGNSLFAVKCMSKDALKRQEMEESVIQEKRILEKTIFPYICGYVKSFHDKKNIYLLMEYVHGKELFDVIRQIKIMSDEITKYFFGCIMLSIEYLHSNNIIYRDLKPENSVVDHHGKVFLIDMGTAKQLNADNYFKTFTIIGTPHYMAPQIFEGKGYSFQTDYWSLGVLLYEFLCGGLPFGDNVNGDPYAIYSLIKKGNLYFPKMMTNQKAKRVIKSLLIKNPIQRSETLNFDKIKRMDYFGNYNWQNLQDEKTIPPYVPKQYRSGDALQIQKMETIPFLKHFYKNEKIPVVDDWNETF